MQELNIFFQGINKFLNKFLSIYLAKYGYHRNRLMFFLFKIYVAKENGNQNPEYLKKVLNFFLDISDSDKRAFGFVLENIF